MPRNERETVYFVVHYPSPGVKEAFLGKHVVEGWKTHDGNLILLVSPLREEKTDIEFHNGKKTMPAVRDKKIGS